MRIILFSILLTCAHLLAQEPMSGNYTIGGNNADFERIQQAADSLLSKGVDGPVIFHIRPGTYEETGGSERVLLIEDEIPGISGQNLITFTPDTEQGGDVSNVIWQRISQSGNPGGYVVEIHYGYIQLINLTIQNADTTSEGIAPSLIHIYPNTNQGADSVFIENCRLIGDAGNRRSYDAIKWNRSFNNMRFLNNTISGCHNGIRHWLTSSGTQARGVVISGNQMTGLQTHRIGGSGTGGYGIRLVEADSAIITDNILDYANGASMYRGIATKGVNYSLIEGNKIMDCSSGYGSPRGMTLGGDHNRIFNNMVTGIRRGHVWNVQIDGSNNLFMHNSIVIPERDAGPGYQNLNQYGLYFAGGSKNQIVNNIFVNLAYNSPKVRVIYDYWGSDSTNIFNNNVYYHYKTEQNKPRIMTNNDHSYYTLEEWQQTGQDLNSSYVLPEFIDINRDLRLDGCSVVDPNLLGVPVDGVSEDIEGDLRSTTTPMIGMDEATEFPQQRFEALSNYASGNIPVSSAFLAASSENAHHLVIANAGSRNLQIFENNGAGTLSTSSSITLPAAPRIIKTCDVDQDGIDDIVAVLDTTENNVVIFYGTGEITFEPMQYLDLPLIAEDIDLYDINGDNEIDLVFSELGTVGVDSGWIGSMPNNGGRVFSDSVWIYRAGMNPGDLVVNYFNNDNLPDVAVVDDFTETVHVLFNRGSGAFDPALWDGFSLNESYTVAVQSPPLLPGLNAEDFDGDGDIDLAIDHANAPDSLVFLFNNGKGEFTSEYRYFDSKRSAAVFTTLDYENDGDIDIITGNNSLDLTLYLNNGNAWFERALLCREGKLDNEPRFLISGQLDGNESADIIALPWTFGAEADSFYTMLNLGVMTSLSGKPWTVITDDFILKQNYPNPYNPETTIPFKLKRASRVKIIVYNTLGQVVAKLVDREFESGVHSIKFRADNLSSGMYIYKMEVNGDFRIRRMLVVK